MHDISGDISASISNHYINISAAVAECVRGRCRCVRARRRRYLAPILAPLSQSSTVVYCFFCAVVVRFIYIYSFSMSHKVYYVNYMRFLAFFLAVSARSCALSCLWIAPKKSLPHHPVIPAWDSLGSPRHRAHQKNLPHTPTLILKGWSPQKIYTIFL